MERTKHTQNIPAPGGAFWISACFHTYQQDQPSVHTLKVKLAVLKAGLEKEHPVSCKANRLKRFTRCWGRPLALKIFGSEGLQEVSHMERQCWKIDIRKPKTRIVSHPFMFSASVRTQKITSETWRDTSGARCTSSRAEKDLRKLKTQSKEHCPLKKLQEK